MAPVAPTSPAAAAVDLSAPHFVGIGGAGMSGLAKILTLRGAKVSGSDAKESTVVLALRRLGAEVHVGHAAENVPPVATALVVSSAIRPDNPELLAARERGLPVVHRSDALARLMDGRRSIAVAGTHGKTTTTSMLAVALTGLGLDPSFAIGGDLNEPGSNAHHGTGDLFVAEADESDRSFHKYAPDVAIVLNVELDHHANYASLEEVYESFETFAGRITPGGTLVVGADDPGARELTRRLRPRAEAGRLRIVTVGAADDADVRIDSITPRGLASDLRVRFTTDIAGAADATAGTELAFTVSVPGRHYAHNATAALAAGVAAGVPAAGMAEALGTYQGVRRRLQLKGTAAGVQVVDSYAHHPTEIAADLEAIRQNAAGGRVLVVFQPHLFSRTQQLGEEMGRALALADAALVTDIYPAREDPVPGVTSRIVAHAALEHGGLVRLAPAMADIPDVVAGMAAPGDLVLTMGAGDVTSLGPQILARLEQTGGQATVTA
ncbi:UDP-N-acetylmuramate--L-alanine ligase [Allostreptomyces psammosilenae]|uniref:UDP-N-acetylmuramate--L-alanine ligase n=1 Tax=Allostreptomyces psammosilenae TaxID=1892865 RepID=A0A852ZLG7_9ACTN|nr:UDP-N-acetylmuramate--L-alanine ligase [Allostreptomyces psammosilenae]NYI03233.1 UDP-N-acetylmuramate--alanine ligase [Allostreptomyces psammosilenae]